MQQMTRIMLLLVGLFHLPFAFAEDTTEVDSVAATVDSLFGIDKHVLASSRPQRENLPNFAASHEALVELKFQDSSALGRIRNLRSFSLVTLAETERSRLFLGINKRGLFGFHFSNRSPDAGDRALELARMPYLKSTAPEKTAQE